MFFLGVLVWLKLFARFIGDTPKALEILSDILQNPKIDENAVEYERSVILREMQEIESQEVSLVLNLRRKCCLFLCDFHSTQEELIMDHLHAVAYQGHPLGYTILGPKVLKSDCVISKSFYRVVSALLGKY